MKWQLLIALVLSVALSACGKAETTCSSDAAKAALDSAFRSGLEKAVAAQTKDNNGNQLVDMSKIRAAIAALKAEVENIRTTKEDPNSTKKFCTGKIKIVFGTQVFADADKAREIAGLPNLAAAADTAGVEKGVDYIVSDLDYSVQPTDDGEKVVAEFEAADAKLDVYGEVVAASLLRSTLETKQRVDQENAAAAQKEQESAMAAANSAAIAEAEVNRKAADEALTAVWKGLDPGIRQSLLPQQRAWIARKDAMCKARGLQSSTDPTEQKVNAINCVTSETQSRISELQNYLGGE